MQPEPLPLAEIGDRRHRVDARRGGRADGGDDGERRHPGPAVIGDRGGERVRSHPEPVVRVDPPQPRLSQPQHDDRLVDRRVRVLGAVDTQRRQVRPAGETAFAHFGRRLLSGGCQRVQRRDRGGVVDDPFECVRQPEQTSQPPQRHLLELGYRGRGAPQHALRVERGAQELGEHAGATAADGEVGEEPGVIPMGQPRHDVAFDVGEDRVHRLAPLGRGLRERVAKLARPRARQHGVAFGVFEIPPDPVDEVMTDPPEFRRVHVAEGRRLIRRGAGVTRVVGHRTFSDSVRDGPLGVHGRKL